MKRRFALMLLIGLLWVLHLSSCKKHYDNYQITDFVMQRVKIEGIHMQDTILYLLNPVADYFYSYEFFLNQSGGTMRGSVDIIDTIIVEDAQGMSLNEGFQPMNKYKGSVLSHMWLVPSDDKSSKGIEICWLGGNLHEWLQKGERMPFYTYKLFSISRDYPVPEYIKIQFPDRVICAKVNNDTMHYKIDGIGIDW